MLSNFLVFRGGGRSKGGTKKSNKQPARREMGRPNGGGQRIKRKKECPVNPHRSCDCPEPKSRIRKPLKRGIQHWGKPKCPGKAAQTGGGGIRPQKGKPGTKKKRGRRVSTAPRQRRKFAYRAEGHGGECGKETLSRQNPP